jgi:hypothetical protein
MVKRRNNIMKKSAKLLGWKMRGIMVETLLV